MTLRFEHPGFIAADRVTDTPWADFRCLEDVALVPLDPNTTRVDTSGTASAWQVAAGSVVSDDAGTRQATLLFPPGVTAVAVVPDGTRTPLPIATLRATEFTVGPGGPAAMPAELPASSAYTYAADFSVEEARDAATVEFDPPLVSYNHNHLGWPVGAVVPVGWYDGASGAWVPEPSGLVIAVLAADAAGLAGLDTNRDGEPDSDAALAGLGITDGERAVLAERYAAGTRLWRTPRRHLSKVDLNGVAAPTQTPPPQPRPRPPTPVTSPCVHPGGSVIVPQSRALGESLPIAGTSLSLEYRSDRAAGLASRRTASVIVTYDTLPESLREVQVTAEVAGRVFTQTLEPAPNLVYELFWDGFDVYGRRVQGPARARITVSYGYQTFYCLVFRGEGDPPALPEFAQPASSMLTALDRADCDALEPAPTWAATRRMATIEFMLGTWWQPPTELGGWSLSVQHVYDAREGVLYLGTGERQAVQPNPTGTAPGELSFPFDVAVAADGSVYVADQSNQRIARIGAAAGVETVAGDGWPDYYGDGGPAESASLNYPAALAVAADGSIYIADAANHRIRKIDSEGIIDTVAGDGDPATLAYPSGVAVAPDGAVIVADTGNHRIRRLGTDGGLATIAGTGSPGEGPGAVLATRSSLRDPYGVAVAPDGTVFVADTGNNRIVRIDAGGMVWRVADGFASPYRVAVEPSGSLLITDTHNHQVKRLTPVGDIYPVAGNGEFGTVGNGIARAATRTAMGAQAVAVAPDGTFYVAGVDELVAIPPNGGARAVAGAQRIPSEDGSDVFEFDATGRHQRTLNALTGHVVWSFGRDEAGRLESVTDVEGNVTRIERTPDGRVDALVSPDGVVTDLEVNDDGWLSTATYPSGDAVRLSYRGASGLLTTFIDARGGQHAYDYTDAGELRTDTDPAGGITRLRTEADGSIVETHRNGTATLWVTDVRADGSQYQLQIEPWGSRYVAIVSPDGARTITTEDGTVIESIPGPDPRFGTAAPLVASQTITTPRGRRMEVGVTRTAQLAVRGDPLSLERLVETVTVNGKEWVSAFERATGTLTVTSPEGRATTFTLDTQGRLASAVVPGLLPATLTYGAGWQESITRGARGMTADLDIDGAGWRVVSTRGGVASSVAYDWAARTFTDAGPDGVEVTGVLDEHGNLLSLAPASRPAHEFTYTLVDLLEDYTPPAAEAGADVQATHIEWRLDRQPDWASRPGVAGVVDFAYDAWGRLEAVTLAAVGDVGAETLTVVYEPNSARAASVAVAGAESVSVAYVTDGPLLTSETWQGAVAGAVGYYYDDNFAVTIQTVNFASPVEFEYDDDGLLTRAGDLALTRDPNNGLLTDATIGTLAEAWVRDDYGALESDRARRGNTALLALDYVTDELGRIAVITEAVPGAPPVTTSFAYEPSGRLDTVTQGDALVADFDWDDNGNRRGWVVDDRDRLLDDGAHTYDWSDAGWLQSKTEIATEVVTAFSHDGLGRLRGVTLPDGRRVSYTLDATGRRVARAVDGVPTAAWLYSGQSIVAELDATGSVRSRFVYGPRATVPDYMVRGGRTYRLLTDHLGSARLVVDTATGEIAQERAYDVWGAVLTDTAPAFQPFGFGGGLYDPATGLVHFGARDYDPAVGRWIQRDPILFGGGDANLYAYALGDPVNLVDPSGLWAAAAAAGRAAWQVAADTERLTQGAAQRAEVISGMAGSGVSASSRVAASTLARTMTVRTTNGIAVQSLSREAWAARQSAENGALIYRMGRTGKQAAAEGQFWSLRNPLTTPEYASQYGLPATGTGGVPFIETATLKPGARFVTRQAPGVATNPGGAIEVVVDPGGVHMQGFFTGL